MLQTRPPVITILGHVDHGKTSILDRIRKSNLAAKEAGQITQAIGAYQISWKGKLITFLDTPGHEVFSKMRSRGVKVADIAILVVAADDGVMPQTKESIKIINEAKIPLIVAINKIDLPTASPEKVKGQLAEEGVLAEGYGGKVVTVPISAKTGEGIDQLLEMILLVAEMEEELKADPEGVFEGVVIESKMDQYKGPVATVLIKNGSLKVGDSLQSENITGKVKLMKSDLGKNLLVGQLGQPVEILGFLGLPPVGARVTKFSYKPTEVIAAIANKVKLPVTETDQEKKLRIILRADSTGSLEAVSDILPAEVQVLFADVGNFCESDILLAKTFSGQIFGFNVKISGSVAKLAETEKVRIKNFDIIYDLLKEIEGIVLHIMEPNIDRQILGKAEIIAEFEVRREKIAGAKVIQGRIIKTDKIWLEREGKMLAETKMKSMRHAKGEISKAEIGQEFGVVFNSPVNFQKGDLIIAWQD